jgi:Tol biopolymer transport system component
VAFHSWRTGTRDIFVKSLEGGTVVQVTNTPAQEAGPVWSADGRSLVFWTIGVSRSWFIIRRDDGGRWGAPVRRGTVETRPEWLRDGSGVALVTASRLWVAPADSGSARLVYAPRSGTDPVPGWVQSSPDGRTLYFKTHDADGRASIWSVPVSGGRPRLLVMFDDLSRPSMRPDFSVDATRFYFGIDDRQSDLWVADIAPSGTGDRR